MKIDGKPASSRTRSRFGRTLGCVLLVVITYSATFGSVHSHGKVSSGPDTIITAGTAGSAFTSLHVPFSSQPGGGECLICAFHQILFNSIVPQPAFIVRPITQDAFTPEQTVFYFSSPNVSSPTARPSGRAPPAERR